MKKITFSLAYRIILSFLTLCTTSKTISAGEDSCLKIWASPQEVPSNSLTTIHQYWKMYLDLRKIGDTRLYFDQNSRNYFITHKVDESRINTNRSDHAHSLAKARLPKEIPVDLPTMVQAERSLHRLNTTDAVAKRIPNFWYVGNLSTMLLGIDNPIIPNSLSPEFAFLGYLGIGILMDYTYRLIPWETWKNSHNPNFNSDLYNLSNQNNNKYFSALMLEAISQNKLSLLIHPSSFDAIKVLGRELKDLEEIDVLTQTIPSLRSLFLTQQLPPFEMDFVFHIDESKLINLPEVSRLIPGSNLKIEPIQQNVEAILDLKLDIQARADYVEKHVSIRDFQEILQKRKDLILYRILLTNQNETKTVAYISLVKGFHSFFGISLTRDSSLPTTMEYWNTFITEIFKVTGSVESLNK